MCRQASEGKIAKRKAARHMHGAGRQGHNWGRRQRGRHTVPVCPFSIQSHPTVPSSLLLLLPSFLLSIRQVWWQVTGMVGRLRVSSQVAGNKVTTVKAGRWGRENSRIIAGRWWW